MVDFYMLAGTVGSVKKLAEIETLLSKADLLCTVFDDEIELQGKANLTLRTGFDHEYIVVGDAIDKSILHSEALFLSNILKHNHIQHEFEIYDMNNELLDVVEFVPD